MKQPLLFLLSFFLAFSALAQKDSIVAMSDGLSGSTSIKADRPVHLLTDKSRLNDSLQPMEFHLSMGGGFIGSNYNSASFFGVTPSVIYRPSDKLSFRASASFVNSYSLAPNGYEIQGRRPRNMAPLRDPGAVASAISMSATYQANDRLWIAGSVMFLNGALASGAIVNPWFAPDMPIELNATAVTAAMRYRVGKDSFLDFHFTFINDRTGALGPLLFGGPYGSPEYYHTTTFGGHLF